MSIVLILRRIGEVLAAVLANGRTLADILRRVKRIGSEQEQQGLTLARILAATELLPAVGFEITVEVEGKIFEGVTIVPMTNSQKATARIKPVGTGGRPAVLDGVPVWASADETLGVVVASPDGLSAEFTPTGPIGTVRVTVTGDADLGQGTTPIFGTLDIDITAGTAVGIEITLDPPVEQ